MEIKKGNINEDPSRDLYWVSIVVVNDDLKTKILACASDEYLFEKYKTQNLTQEIKDNWVDNVVIEKWKKLGNTLFEQDIHYDVYALTQEGEANGFDFLLKKFQSS